MSRAENIATLSSISPIAQRRDWERLSEAIARNAVDHGSIGGQPTGVEGIEWYWRNFTTAFADWKSELVVLSADGDYVTVVARLSGTHTGEYEGHAPTGRKFSVFLVQAIRFSDGLMVEFWGGIDSLGLLQQLGLV